MSLAQRNKNTPTNPMEGLPPGVTLPEPPPPGFDPIDAPDDLLIKHGLPPRPNSKSEPEYSAWWTRVCSRAHVYVCPGFEPLTRSDSPASLEEISKRWSGAFIARDQGYIFRRVIGSWTVSRPFPDNFAWQTTHWSSGKFKAASWVGIDGHSTPDCHDSHDVLQAGVAHICITSIHQDTEYITRAWWEWYPGAPCTITGFQIKPGDLVHVYINATSSRTATVYFFNDSACTYTSFSIEAPEGVHLKGNCAEWIVEAPHESLLCQHNTAYLGATFFFDCMALEENNRGWRCRDVSNATFIEAVEEGEVVSTGRKDLSNNKVIGIVAEQRTHYTKISH